MPTGAVTPSKSWRKSSRINPESGRRSQFVGFLNVGHDVRRLPQGFGGDRLQGDGPVALTAAGPADDLDCDAATQRMPIEREHHAPADLVERRGCFGKVMIKIHFKPPVFCGSPQPWRRTFLWGYCWG